MRHVHSARALQPGPRCRDHPGLSSPSSHASDPCRSRAFSAKLHEAINRLQVMLAQMADEEQAAQRTFDACVRQVTDEFTGVLADYKHAVAQEVRWRLGACWVA